MSNLTIRGFFKAMGVIAVLLLSACDADPENYQAAERALVEAKSFLAENAQKPGITVTQSGLQYEVLNAGEPGPSPTRRSIVSVHYVGRLANGEEFDSSLATGAPVSFPLNRVIQGWTEGLQLMRPGAKYRFYVPPALGYGARGSPPVIPPHAVLVFEVELVGFETPEDAL